jgi:conjugal transfer ATP-binding protein TraC
VDARGVVRQILGLELEDLANLPDLKRVVLFSIMAQVSYEMFDMPRSLRKIFFMDEAWQELSAGANDNDSAGFIELGFRRARKYEGAFGLGTQGLEDYLKSPAGTVAYNNADWKFLGHVFSAFKARRDFF